MEFRDIIRLLILVISTRCILSSRNTSSSNVDDELNLFLTVKIAGIFPDSWEVLGPFPIGSREQGIDPLSTYGGFENLKYSTNDKYYSELAEDGYTTWQTIQTNADQSVGPVLYSNVKWGFNQDVFGWSSLQHSTYFRGEFYVQETGVYSVKMNNVLSFKIDDTAYVGNVYAFNHASSTMIRLSAGKHMIYINTVYDVRIFGGSTPSDQKFYGEILLHIVQDVPIIIYDQDTLLPEVMDRVLISPFASVTLMNSIVPLSEDVNAESGWLHVISVSAILENDIHFKAAIPLLNSVFLGIFSCIYWSQNPLAPRQIYPLPIELDYDDYIDSKSISILIKIMEIDSNIVHTIRTKNYTLDHRSWGDVYKMTFKGYDNTIQYGFYSSKMLFIKAMAIPPANIDLENGQKYPVVLALHGSGIHAHWKLWTDSYKKQDSAWILFPTGRTHWGFDWHGPSHLSVLSALETLRGLPGVPKDKKQLYAPDITKLLYSGHSNGGQGAWWYSAHYPDSAIAVLPASSYIKIQLHVPFYMRIGDAYVDPVLRGIMEASISENDLDLHSSNMVGIPILARSGSADMSIPAYHSRRLIRLVNSWSNNSNDATLSEIPTQGHWFDGILNDDMMNSFIQKHAHYTNELPKFPDTFTLTCINPATTGNRGGLKILQLEVPFRLGQIKVHRKAHHWSIITSNIRRFMFVDDSRKNDIHSFSIDGKRFASSPENGPSYLKLSPSEDWNKSDDLQWLGKERHANTYGPINQILQHPFVIIVPSIRNELSATYMEIANHLALSWYIYGRGATQIIRDDQVRDGDAARYNMIVLGGPKHNMYTKQRSEEGDAVMISFTDSGYKIGDRFYGQVGTGILFLAPSRTRTRLSLFIDGLDEQGLLKAAWSVPFRTGLMIPDYLILGDAYGDPSTGWTSAKADSNHGTKGMGGILAAGYWNNHWAYDDRCGYLK